MALARQAALPKKRALDYAAEQLIRFGYQPQFKPVAFAPLPACYLENIAAGVILIGAGWMWPYFPWLTLLTPVLLLLLPELEKWETGLRNRSQYTENVVAFNESSTDLPLLVFCAHIDSAPAMALDHPFLTGLFAQGMRILQRIAILIALLSLVMLLGFSIPFPIFLPVAWGATLLGGCFALHDLINQLDHRKGYSPGAVDNASGVGMVLAMAEYFAEEGAPKRLRLGFLITAAEETGLHGAEAYAHELSQKPGKVAVFNLDMVGAGSCLQVVTRQGSLITHETTPTLNEVIFDVSPPVKPGLVFVKKRGFCGFSQSRYRGDIGTDLRVPAG